jgi:zinc protease
VSPRPAPVGPPPAPGRRRRAGGAAGLALAAALLAVAAPAPAGAAPAASLGTRVALGNGLVVLVAERPGLPVVHVRASVLAGSVLDPPGRAGLASLTARLLTRGTESRPGPEIDRAIEFVGGALESVGGRDGAEVSLAVLRRDLDLGLDLLADVLRRPTFPSDEVERARAETLATLRRAEEDPAVVAGRAFRQLVFPGHPYGAPVDGTEATVAVLGRDEVLAFHRTAYRPGATVVAIAGDVATADAVRAVEARLGGWTEAAPGPPAPPPAPAASPPRTERIPRDLAQATILLGRATVGRDHPDYYALAVAAQVLGGGSSSRLYARVREERGLAYSVYAGLHPGRLGGMLLVEAQCAPGRVGEVLGLLRAEVARLGREPVPAGELARARAYLAGSFPLRLATTGDLASLLVGVERFGLGLDYAERYVRAVRAVTARDVLRAVAGHWPPASLSLVVVGAGPAAPGAAAGPAAPGR